MNWKNKLYYGDNLDVLRKHIPDEYVDLVYIDPPFNSKATYNVLFQEKNGAAPAAQVKAFEDTWHWDIKAEEIYSELVTTGPKKLADLIMALRTFLGTNDMMAYLTMMAVRLVEMHRVLKPTGSIYLHCDPTASHYLKLVMDAIFNFRNFRNEIIWCYKLGGRPQKGWPKKHDIILFYTKLHDDSFKFNSDAVRVPYESTGGYISSGRKIVGDKIYEVNPLGKVPEDWWFISVLNRQSKERLGYPTQKPEALLERIIEASSNEGDLVLDAFCGCGTTIAVAERLHRKWIGIDITHLAIALMKYRLENTFGKELSPYEIIGIPKDQESAKALADQDKYQFEWWALSLVEARPAGEQKKGADKGIDGYIYFFDDNSGQTKKVIIQVKGGHITVSQIRDLKGVLEREKAQIGAFITLHEPTRPMREEAASAGFYEPEIYMGKKKYPRLQILTINELLDGKQLDFPRLQLDTFKKAERKSKKDAEQTELF